MFAAPLHFDFCKNTVHPHGLKVDLTVRVEFNCIGDTTATYNLSEISLEYDSIFD